MSKNEIPDCKCGNTYLAIRTDIYKDQRPFVYCDCCGALADKDTWIRANRKLAVSEADAISIRQNTKVTSTKSWSDTLPLSTTL